MRTSRDRRRSGAFTLLEVLAAVLVLGLLYAVLADVAMQGLRSEGETNRRLEASLLADRVLADIEQEIAAGSAPPIDVTESEQEPYYIEVRVEPLAMPAGLVDPQSPEGAALQDILGGEGQQEPRLRSILIRVAWFEVEDERSVVRTTFALDSAGLDALLPAQETGADDDEAPTAEDLPDLNDLGNVL